MNDRQHLDPSVSLPEATSAGYGGDMPHPNPAVARAWWDANARDYLADHAADLGDANFVWGPEGLREADAHLLGEVTGRRVLEVGAGAAQCSRYLHTQGGHVVATDISGAMLAASKKLDAATGIKVPAVQADARMLPFADGTFETAFTSYGVLPFVPDDEVVHREIARVLVPGGAWVFSVNHPVRWAFPDDPGTGGLTATRSYYDTRPYLEHAGQETVYAEYHRTLGDYIAHVAAAGFVVVGITEPQWSPHRSTWGGWSELRAAYLPGTIIVQCRLTSD